VTIGHSLRTAKARYRLSSTVRPVAQAISNATGIIGCEACTSRGTATKASSTAPASEAVASRRRTRFQRTLPTSGNRRSGATSLCSARSSRRAASSWSSGKNHLIATLASTTTITAPGLDGRADLVEQDARHRRERGAVEPPLGAPEPGAPEGLRAVEEALLHFDADGDQGALVVGPHRLEELVVADDPCAPVHTERLLA